MPSGWSEPPAHLAKHWNGVAEGRRGEQPGSCRASTEDEAALSVMEVVTSLERSQSKLKTGQAKGGKDLI